MRIKNIFSLLALSSIVFTYSSCNKKDPIVINEDEWLTTLTYTLTSTDGTAAVVMTFKDLDGDGGNAPEITGGTLISGMTYDGVITLSNESETPVEDITQEVQTEGVDHQFFF
ncbi:MAG TPA: type 1 periplasmic binding fold superfamily protein, partial [Saprospiraceae bacterium]|nr:type 1 periplasmic binding fold superfamily protein [Saprospiraceae bacterium]